MVHSRTWCLRKPSHWNKNASTHFLMWVRGTAWGVLDANKPSTPGLEGYPLWGKHVITPQSGCFMWAQSMQLSPCFSLRKSGTEAMCLYSPGDAWRCLWTLSISTVVAVLVFCWPLVDREQGCCRLPPLAEQDPMGPFEFRPIPHDLCSPLVSEKL